MNITIEEKKFLELQYEAHYETWSCVLQPHLRTHRIEKTKNELDVNISTLRKLSYGKRKINLEQAQDIKAKLSVSERTKKVIFKHMEACVNIREKLESINLQMVEVSMKSLEEDLEEAIELHKGNNLIDSLYNAKYVRLIISEIIKDAILLDWCSLLIQGYRLESMNLRALSLFEKAFECIQEAKKTILYNETSMQQPYRHWRYTLLHEELQALIARNLKRWSKNMAIHIGSQLIEAANNEADKAMAEQLIIQALKAKARGGKDKTALISAGDRIEVLVKKINNIQNLPISDRLITMKLAAQIMWQLERMDDWDVYIRQTLSLASQSNNRLQLKQIIHDYKGHEKLKIILADHSIEL